MTLHHERDNVYRLEVRGLLQKHDFQRCQDMLTEAQRLGPVKLLFVLREFEGWDPQDDWQDLTYYVEHGDDIERIAIVGDERWRDESLMFAGADLRQASVEFFAGENVAGARAWLSSRDVTSGPQKTEPSA